MPGCVEPWLGFPPEIRQILTPSKEETNDIWNTKVVPELPPEAAAVLKKRFEPFSVPAMLQARQGKLFTDFYTPATRIQALSIASVISRIKAPTLVLDYEDEQFYPGQPRRLYDALTSPKDYVKLTAAQGAQLHCSHGPAAALRGRLRLAPGDPAGRRLMSRVRPRRSAASR